VRVACSGSILRSSVALYEGRRLSSHQRRLYGMGPWHERGYAGANANRAKPASDTLPTAPRTTPTPFLPDEFFDVCGENSVSARAEPLSTAGSTETQAFHPLFFHPLCLRNAQYTTLPLRGQVDGNAHCWSGCTGPWELTTTGWDQYLATGSGGKDEG
jgi:hypothetical protein